MEARKTGGSWLAAFCMAVFLLTAFTAGAWAGDVAAFLSKTYPDNSTISGGTSFIQSWTIRNSGTTTWTSSYKLRWISGGLNSNHTDIPIYGTVAPGANYTFSVSMRTPAASSSAITYRDDWKFINSSGTTLNTFWAQIVVPAASDDHGNGISTATAVSVNTGRAGVINYGGDYDYFRIVAPSNGTLTVYTTGSTDTYGYLKNSSGSNLASNDDQSTSNANFRISQSVTAGTTYYVAVRNYYSTGTGSYTFYASFAAAATDDHGNSISAATAVNVNSSTAGTINYGGDYDYFRVSVPSSGTLTVYTTGSTDTYGILKNSSGSDIASNDDYNGGVNFRISQSVSAGTYYVAVRHYSSTGTGSYTLYVSGPSQLTAANLNFPCTGSGWSHTSGSSYHRAGGGYQGMNDTYALDLNLNTPTYNLDAGRPIYPISPGRIIVSNLSLGFVLIQHTQPLRLDDGTVLNNWYSGYMHMANIAAINTPAEMSTVLGQISRTGGTNDHLHFAIYSGNHTSGYSTLTSISTRTNLQAFASKITYWY